MSEEKKKPIHTRWWFIVLVIIFIIGGVNGLFESKEEKAEKEEQRIAAEEEKKQKELEKEEKKKKEQEEKAKEEERLANRTIDEILQEDEKDVSKATLKDGTLRLENDLTTFWDETSILKLDVLKMFELLPEAFKDDEVDRVRVVFNIEMIDQKGNKEVEPAIYFEYSRTHFEELAYDDFLWMATSETWRILNESTSYEIHPGIYQKVDNDYKNNLNTGLSKIEE